MDGWMCVCGRGVNGCSAKQRRHAAVARTQCRASLVAPLSAPPCIQERGRRPPPAPRVQHTQLNIYLADDPVLCAWQGAALLGASPLYSQLAVTQKEWRSRGMAALAKWDQ